MVRQRSRLFYGWLIVGACFLISMYSSGVVFYGFTAIFKPIAEEFDWSYVAVSLAASVRGMEAGLLAPLLGILIDRWGARRLMFAGAVSTAIGLVLLSRMQSLGMFYLSSFLTAVGASSAGISVTTVVVGHWFRRRIGLATGIMVGGHGAAGLMLPLVVSLVDLYGWRTAVLAQAIGMMALVLPLTLIIRDKPEPYGYLPDGEDGAPFIDNGSLAAIAREESISARAAFRSRTLWFIIAGLSPQFIVVGAVFTHVMPYLTGIGLSSALASLVATIIPLISIVGRFGLGWSSDRFSKKMLSAGALASLAVSLAFFEFAAVDKIWMLLIFSVLFGLGYGGNISMLGILLRDRFGRGSYGTIIGFTWGILLIGNIFGPPFVGWFYDNGGSYRYAWLVLAGVTLIGAVVMAMTPMKKEGKAKPLARGF